jgi:transcriptional regulator with XRE-family HTH domain
MLKDNLAKKMDEKGDGFRCSVLSRKTGIPHETILQILKGNTKNPGVFTIAKIADELSCSIDELIGRTPKTTTLTTLHSANANYDENLFSNVCDYVINLVKEKLKQDNSNIKLSTIIDIIDSIYDYSYKKNHKAFDTQFADWYCQTYLVK